jgi:hypothetical protein
MKKRSKTLLDAYKDFRKESKKEPLLLNISRALYRTICMEFNRLLSENIMKEALEFKIPANLGALRVKKIKGNKTRRVDWKTTKKHNTKVYHLNFHTDGYYYKWFWHKKRAIFTNKSAYSFTPTRYNKRTLAGLLKTNQVEFFE